MTNLSKAERAKYDLVIGSRRQVYNGTAHHTSGGLTKKKLFMTKNGRIVSKSKHFSAKKENRLKKHGYGAKKGKFGFVLLKGHKGKSFKKGTRSKTHPGRKNYTTKKGNKVFHRKKHYVRKSRKPYTKKSKKSRKTKKSRKSRKMRGGSGHLPLSPANYDGAGVPTSGVELQEKAGQAGGSKLMALSPANFEGGAKRRKKGGEEVPQQ